MKKQGFPPIVNEKCKVLILGSMPGEESIRRKQYYAYKQNAFWEIMARLFGFSVEFEYKCRTQILLKNNIAVWDVISDCQRNGSLDSSIKPGSILTNDFGAFYTRYSAIKFVFFNGKMAEKQYTKHVTPALANHANLIKYVLLPSTSPAHAQISKEEKYKRWSILLSVLK